MSSATWPSVRTTAFPIVALGGRSLACACATYASSARCPSGVTAKKFPQDHRPTARLPQAPQNAGSSFWSNGMLIQGTRQSVTSVSHKRGLGSGTSKERAFMPSQQELEPSVAQK